MRNLILALSVFAVVVAAGCFLDHGKRTEPSGFEVDAAIAGVSLGEDCGETGLVAPRCGADEPSGSGDAPSAGDCEGDCCGSLCQQSSVTLAIAAEADRPLPFRVLSVTLLDASGTSLMPLDAQDARVYSDEGYVAWDESIPTPSDIQVLYDLRGIDWSAVTDSYSRTYRLRLQVEIDGETRTLTSEETTREAPLVT